MALIFVLIAAIFAAATNLCLRKNCEFSKSAKGYLSLYFIFSFLISFAFRPDLDIDSFSPVMGSIGVISGLINLLMMLLLARSVQIGPSGLTFAFQNSSSMLPSLLLFFLFGAPFGFKLPLTLILGFFCVFTGLFLSVRKDKKSEDLGVSSQWLFFALLIFLMNGLLLSIFQWRSLLLTPNSQAHCLIPWSCSPQEDLWFMPGFFFVPTLVQSAIFYFSEKRWFTSKELLFGFLGGVFNGSATFFLLMATRVATQNSRPILFPLFAITIIFLCNLWGKKLYQEPIEWKGLLLCLGGVFIGSL